MDNSTRIFILDDDQYFGTYLTHCLEKSFSKVMYFQDEEMCIKALHQFPEILILDHKLENSTGLQIIEEVERVCGDRTNIIYLSSQEHVHITLKALKAGAVDYFEKSTFSVEHLGEAISRIAELTGNYVKPLDIDKYRQKFNA